MAAQPGACRGGWGNLPSPVSCSCPLELPRDVSLLLQRGRSCQSAATLFALLVQNHPSSSRCAVQGQRALGSTHGHTDSLRAARHSQQRLLLLLFLLVLPGTSGQAYTRCCLLGGLPRVKRALHAHSAHSWDPLCCCCCRPHWRVDGRSGDHATLLLLLLLTWKLGSAYSSGSRAPV